MRERYERAEAHRKGSSGMTRFYGNPKQDVTPYGAEEDTQANIRGQRGLYEYQQQEMRQKLPRGQSNGTR